MHAVVHNVIRSDPFTVLPQPKRLPKPEPPAEILLALAAQGAKIKIRKPNEDRVKRKTDWSINANNQEWPVQTQIGQPPVSMPMSIPMSSHSQMLQQQQQQIPMQQHHFLTGPMPLPVPMPMTTAPYQMSIQAQVPMSYPQQQTQWPMQAHEISHDMNFNGFQDPHDQYVFNGSHPQQHGYGNGYGNNY